MIGVPSTNSITKYGNPSVVVPPSKSRVMFGCSRLARIWRSIRKRRRTSSVSVPRLRTLIATRFSKCPSARSARYTAPIPPRPSSLITAYAPIRSPIRSRSSRLSRAAANSANSSKTVVSWARSFSASRRSVVSSAHDSLSTAVCLSTDGCSNASARISLSRCQRAGSDLICVVIDTIVLFPHL